MDIIISNTSDEPIYQQIIDQVKKMIIAGEVAEGEALPSIRQLAKDLRISVITTKRAYEELEREGFIRSVQGKGSYVAPYNREIIRESRLKMIEEKLRAVIDESKTLNISLEEVIDILRYLYQEKA
ncbi:MAG TPA: GntR family transcriptional regulator [Peptococcaceae bacterium]|nr:GntR family transcriptional regulator [Peptococcaceae bacterium]